MLPSYHPYHARHAPELSPLRLQREGELARAQQLVARAQQLVARAQRLPRARVLSTRKRVRRADFWTGSAVARDTRVWRA